MATRADVARHARVSESTVSYVMSGSRPISAQTRARVLAAMDELHYIPNAMARALAGRRTGIVAWHFPVDVHGLSITELEYIFAATEQARSSDRHVLLWTNPADDVESLIHLVSQGLVDGVVLTEVYENDARVVALRHSGIPFVLIGRNGDEDVSLVDADFSQMAELALRHLSELGHRHVAWLSDRAEFRGYGPLIRLKQELNTAAEQFGMQVDSVVCKAAIREGRDAFEQVAARGVTAVLGLSELALVGLVEAARDQGFTVPGDLSVVALGVAQATARMMSPILTTVTSSGEELGRRAVSLLEEVIAGGGPTQELVSAKLYLGESCARPAFGENRP